jgi:hypothetical protein
MEQERQDDKERVVEETGVGDPLEEREPIEPGGDEGEGGEEQELGGEGDIAREVRPSDATPSD